MSSVTMSADGGITSAPAKKATLVHSTAIATQMRRKAAFEKKKEYNTAFKRATIVYAQEKGKDDGVSARTVADPEGVTRACLDNPQAQVLQNLSSDDDDDDTKLKWSIQAANDRAVHALKQAGNAAEYLQATLQQGDAETDRPITQPNTLARQQALTNARGRGGRFHVTGGMHITSDDLFISMEMNI